MKFNDYVPLARRTAKLRMSARLDMEHALLGLITELGEFTTEVKRMTIYGAEMTDERREHMIEEAGDILWYIPLAMLALGLDELPGIERERIDSESLTGYEGGCKFIAAMIGTISACHMAMRDSDDLGDLVNFLDAIVYVIDNNFALALGTTGDDIRARNIAKLRARFPDKYSDEAAEARADKGGLDARNS